MKRTLIHRLVALSLCLITFLPFIQAQVKPVKDLKPTVILISLDGFRYDYLDKYNPKILNKLAKNGVRAKWMIPAFPTKTFPNHYTIATGLYPEHHGIVENTIYSKEFNAVFSLGKREEVENSRWWLGEPIWVTAEKQGQRAASFFFVGSEAEIMGVRPTFWKEYDGKIPNETRVDTVLSWLDLPQMERPTLYTMYFSDTDDAGHEFSPESKETAEAVQRVDNAVGRLLDGLKKRKINKKVNLIIVSDHGMARVNPENAIFLDDIFDLEKAQITWSGEIVGIFPKDGEEEAIYQALKEKLPTTAKVYRKSEVPARFHYDDSPRIAPILVLPDEGWALTSHQRYRLPQKNADGSVKYRGAHGYDNALESMRATFIAHGAAFKKGLVVEPFENMEIYNLMAKILSLKPARNDGNFENVKNMLR